MNIKINILFLFFFVNIFSLISETTYNEYNLPTEENLKLVEFFDKLNGVIVTESGQIYYTNSMAKKWTNVDLKIDYTPEKLIYSESGEAIIIGSDSTVLKSYNYGRDWLILSHDGESDVVFNFVISRNANEYYLTEKGNNNIYYSYDGLNSLTKVNTENINRTFRSYPLVYSKSKNELLFAGIEDYSTENNVEFYHYFGLYVSNNCKQFTKMYAGVNALGKPILNRYKVNDIIEIDDKIIKISDYSINFYEGSYYDYIDYSKGNILESQDSIRKVKKTGKQSLVVLLNNGKILKYSNIYYNTFGLISLDFKLDTVDLQTQKIFDYDKIGESNSIVISNGGNYFLSYDRYKIDIYNNNDKDTTDNSNDSDRKDDDSVGINIIYTNNDFFPNPTNDVTKIIFENRTFVKAIEVYTFEGRLIIKNDYMKKMNTYQLNLKELQSSKYFIKIITDKGSIYKNIIKF